MEDSVTILRIETGEAVKSVNDLRENIKTLKERLGDLDIGSQEYQKTLNDLKQNQAALKDAMYATRASMEDVATNAKGLNVVFDENNKLINQENQSYNALVNTMAELKTAWRATADEQKRAELGEQIKQVNDRLKDMDASVGNYSRNVGDYTNQVKAAFEGADLASTGLGKAIKAVDTSSKLMAANPIMGVLTLLLPLIRNIADSVKESETATNAVNKAMTSLKPVMDLVSKVIETIAGWVAKAVDWFVSLAGESGGTFKKVIAGAVGVNKALQEYMLMPVKTLIEAFKGLGNVIKDVFTGDFKKVKEDAMTAAQEIGETFKKGISFKANFEEGKRIGEEFINGLGEEKVKEVAEEKGVEIGRSINEGIEKGLAEIKDGWQNKMDVGIAARMKAAQEAAKVQEELNDMVEADTLATQEFVDNVLAEVNQEIENSNRAAEEQMKQRIESMQMVAGVTSSILGSIADMYESDEKNSERNANRVKALRIASATIDTISGALGAYMQAVQTIPPPAGAITGAIQAAAVTAAGIAQIAKMKSTKVSGSSASTSSASAPAVTSAPSRTMDLPNVRSVTSASEEERLNQMAGDQRVVLVMSDLEIKQNQQRVQVAEATF